MNGFRSQAVTRGRTLRCLLALSLLAPCLARAAAEPHDADPYWIDGPVVAEPTRHVLAEPAPGSFASARAQQLVDDARAFGLSGRPLPPARLTSTGIESALAGLDPVSASLETARAHPALIALDAADLELTATKEAGDLTYVHFRQTVGGIPVHDSRVTFLWDDAGRLRMTGTRVYVEGLSDPSPSVPRPVWISEQAAREGAIQGMPSDLEIEEWEFAERQWLPLTDQDSVFALTPIWNIRFRTSAPAGWYDARIDGETGSLLSRVNRIHFETVIGSMKGYIEPVSPGDEQALLSIPNQFVLFETAGDSAFATGDIAGGFTVDLADGDHLVTNALAGRYIVIFDGAIDGETPTVTHEVVSALPVDHVWSDENSNSSHRDAYYHGNIAYAAIRAIDSSPGIFPLDYPMPTVVEDHSGACNAYWNGARMNFYAAGGPCPSTARIADVVYHEYGHAVTQWTYWPMFAPSDIHEGLSDYFAATIRDNSAIGAGFFGPGSVLRDIEPDRVYPTDVQPDPHATGLIVAGALWDLRKVIGKETTDRLFHFARYSAPEDFDDYLLNVLLVDDDDADLTNGSPNFEEIVEAFTAHGIGDFTVSISAPKFPDVENPGPTIGATISVFALLGLDPNELSLFIDTDGSGFERVPMVPTQAPRTYRVEFESPPSGTTVRYYWAAADTAGHVTRLPANAPNETYSFFVGPDEIAPVITAETPSAFAETQTRYYFRCTVTDNSQRLGPVRAEYRVGGGPLHSVELTSRGGDEYEGTLELGTLVAGEDVVYRLLATDQANDPNTGTLPSTGDRRVPVRRGRSIDFESSVSELLLEGDWEIGSPSDPEFAYSGSGALATRLDGLYADSDTSDVVWGPIDLAGYSRARLEFRHLVKTELFYDGGNVSFTTDPVNGPWSVLHPVGGYTLPGIVALGEPGFTGVADWSQAVFPLDFHLGDQIYLRFRFAADQGVRDFGWYIDDLMVLEAQAWVDAIDFEASSGEDSRVSLTWEFPSGVDRNSGRFLGFDLYRAAGDLPFPEDPINPAPLLGYEFVDEEVTNGQTYRYRLVTIYDDGRSPGIEAFGSPYAASIELGVSAVEATLHSYEPLIESFTIGNRGAGTLTFDVFQADLDATLEELLAIYRVPSEAPTLPEVLAEDSAEGLSEVDLASVAAHRWSNEGVELVEFRLSGYGEWGDPIHDWGGVLFIDLDGNLDTSQDSDVDLGWNEGTNMGWEKAVVFGSLPSQVGLPGVAVVVDPDMQSQPRVLTDVDFPIGGNSLAFSVPLDELDGAREIQVLAVTSRSFAGAPLDYLPDLPGSVSWLQRSPKHGRALQEEEQSIEVTLGNSQLPNGVYHTQLLVRSNDESAPVVALPITLTIDRGVPPSLNDVRLSATLAGMQIAILPNRALEPDVVHVERSTGDEEWIALGDTLARGEDGYYRITDRSAQIGETYQYRFPIEFPGDRTRTYGPFEQIYSPAPPDLQPSIASVQEGIEVSFTVPYQLDVFQSIWVDRREVGTEQFAARHEETLEPDPQGRVTLFDPWSVPWADGLEPGAEYEYRVRLIGPEGQEHIYPLEPVEFIPPMPDRVALLPSRPNPFRDRVAFRIDLPAETDVDLELFDGSGRRIATLVDGPLSAGAHQREWNGRADSGEQLPSGVYFARLRAGGEERKIRVLRVR